MPKMTLKLFFGLLLAGACLSAEATRASTLHNFYDAAGRFVGSTQNPQGVKSLQYDKADNRTNIFVSPFVPLTSSQQISNYQVLTQGDSLVSADGRFVCAFQEDGNVVVKQGAAQLWSTSTALKPSAWFDMQGDGNLLLYDIAGAVLWQSATGGNPGASLVMQSDGNLVIYTTGGAPIWSSGTGGH